MKRKTLFIITTVMIMSLTGCGTSKEVPVLSESVETETVTEDTLTEEVTDNIQEETTEPEQQAIGSDEIIDESALTEEKVQLEEEEQNEENTVLEEVVGEDEADPSLSQKRQDLLDSIFGGMDDASGYEMGGRYDDPTTEGGVKYYGGEEAW